MALPTVEGSPALIRDVDLLGDSVGSHRGLSRIVSSAKSHPDHTCGATTDQSAVLVLHGVIEPEVLLNLLTVKDRHPSAGLIHLPLGLRVRQGDRVRRDINPRRSPDPPPLKNGRAACWG